MTENLGNIKGREGGARGSLVMSSQTTILYFMTHETSSVFDLGHFFWVISQEKITDSHFWIFKGI